jgi:hypothetical protein
VRLKKGKEKGKRRERGEIQEEKKVRVKKD